MLAALVVVACGGIAFTAANAPALFGEFERRADVPYGTGARQRLDVYTPSHAQSRPIIVFWYGGGWERGRKSQYRFVGAALAKAGYVAVLPDYRLYPEVKFPAFVQDGAEALAWVVSHAARSAAIRSASTWRGIRPGRTWRPCWPTIARSSSGSGCRRTRCAGSSGSRVPTRSTPTTRPTGPYSRAPFATRRLATGAIGEAAGRRPRSCSTGKRMKWCRWATRERWRRRSRHRALAVTLRTYEGRGHRDTVAAFAVPAPHKLPVIEEIRRFVK